MSPLSRLALAALALAGAAAAEAQLSISDASVTEGDAGMVKLDFVVTLITPLPPDAPGPRPPVDVTWATRDGSAVAAGDYLAASGTLSFPGSLPTETQTISIDVNGDLRVEADENLFVDLVTATGATITDGEGEGTIFDDDATELSLGDATLSEGDAGAAAAALTATLSAPSDFVVTAAFASRDGSATTADGDYQATTGTVTFNPGETTRTVAVLVNGDTKAEADETFFVDLSAVVNATLVDGEGQTTVLNDDAVKVSIDDVTVTEGDAGTTQALFTVSLSAASDSPVGVAFATRDGAATRADGDYRAASGTLTFPPGQTSLPLSVAINGDLRAEPDESFFVELSGATGATIADGSGQATIENDDEVALAIGDVTVSEGDAGSVEAVFAVGLTAASALPVGVDFATRDGSATVAGGDYRAARGRLTFVPGQTALSVPVQVLGDLAVEPDESFTVVLSNPSGAGLAVASGRATILNDDVLSEIRLVSAPAVSESVGVAVVTAERVGAGGGAARVTLTAASGSATAGEDFTPATVTLSWPAGDAGPRTAEVEILADNLVEGDEIVVVSLSDPVGAVLAPPSVLDLVILDDDAAVDLRIVGDAERTSKVGEEIELRVLVTGIDGGPVAGATVGWTLEGEAELLDGASTSSDGAGEAVQHVLLGEAPGTVVVGAALGGGGQHAGGPAVEFRIRVEGDLDELFDALDSPGESSLADVLNEICLEDAEALGDFCGYLFGLDPADQRAVIRELTPDEVAGQGAISIGGQRIQLDNIGSRLAAARAGAGSGASQLGLTVRGVAVPLDRLGPQAGAAAGEASFLARVDAALFGAQEPAAAAPELVIDEPSRWSLFVNGRVELGDRPATRLEEGFELETLGLTLGIDYRLSGRLVAGLAAGYLDTETDLAGGGALDATGFSLSAFGTYFEGDFWIDGVVTYGVNDYDSARVIVLPEPLGGRTRFVARAKPEGSQTTLALGAGYEAAFGAASLGGFANLSRVEVDVDAYVESGAEPFDLAIAEQSLESLLLEAGVELTYARSRSWGVLQPVLRASLLHEFEDDSRLIVGSFAADPEARSFGTPTDAPDRDFLRLGAGATATLARGLSLFLLYETDLERDDLDLRRLSGGLRLEL